MRNNYLKMPRDLTSFEFYNTVLPQAVVDYKQQNNRIVFDFSEAFRIEPLVIPNFLCLGYALKLRTDSTPEIYIPDTSNTGKLKNYLYEIGFIRYAKEYNLFAFSSSPYGGLEGKQIDPLCNTVYIDAEYSNDDIVETVCNCVAPFSDKYLCQFESLQESEGIVFYENEITRFLSELLINSKEHAESFSFATLHAKYSTKKIYISVSDYGCGFLNTIGRENACSNELESIFAGVYQRKNSKVYGLFNVIRRIMEYDGKVRIHSNDMQVIFTPRVLEAFVEGELISTDGFLKYNTKETKQFDGVHVEIELPMER